MPFLDLYTIDPYIKNDIGYMPVFVSVFYLAVNIVCMCFSTIKIIRDKCKATKRTRKDIK